MILLLIFVIVREIYACTLLSLELSCSDIYLYETMTEWNDRGRRTLFLDRSVLR